MAEERDEEQEQPQVPRVPELPPLPDLPEAPRLRPNLPPRPRADDGESSEYQRAGLAYTLPIALAAPIVVLTVLGYWLDQRFHWSPWGTMVGALLGFVTGLINMIRMASKLNS